MLVQILLFTVFASVNSMRLPSPCRQRPMSIVVPSVAPACANQFSVMSLPYDLPCSCNPPIKYIESVNYGFAPRCGPVAEIVAPEIMPVALPPARCGPIAEIAVPNVMPVGLASARCGRIAEIAVPEIMPFGVATTSCGRVAEIAVPEIMPIGMAPARCGRIPEIAVPEIMPIGFGNPFLPAASPVSAMAPPFYPFTPPMCPCECKCHYLKKIPIPPPCI